MKIKYTARIIIILTFALMLSACVGIKREITIKADGSGKEKMSIRINKNNLLALQKSLTHKSDSPQDIKEDDDDIENIFKDTLYLAEIRGAFSAFEKGDDMKIISVKEKNASDTAKTIEITYTFTDVEYLMSDKLPMKVGVGVQNNMTEPGAKLITKGDEKEFSYLFGVKPKSDSASLNDSLKIMTDIILTKLFGSGQFELSVKVPGDITDTNGEAVSDRKAMWRFPMIEFLKNPQTLKVKFEK